MIEIKANEFRDPDGDGGAVVVNKAVSEFRVGESCPDMLSSWKAKLARALPARSVMPDEV